MRWPSARHVMWVTGIGWIVSWACLWLEIVHWRHVTKTLRLNPPQVPAGHPRPKPGHFPLSVLAGSALAPTVFLVAAIVAWAKAHGARPRGKPMVGP